MIRAGKSAFSGSTLVTSGTSIVTTGQPSIVATQKSLATTKQTAILQTITTTATTGSVLRCFRGDGFCNHFFVIFRILRIRSIFYIF